MTKLNTLKKPYKVFIVALIVFIILFIIIGSFLTMGMDKVKSLKIESISFKGLKDGIYIGSFDSNRWSNTLEVTISDEKITDIKIIKDITLNKKEWFDKIFNNLKGKTYLDTDTISGATVSSKAYIKSVYNALEGKNAS